MRLALSAVSACALWGVVASCEPGDRDRGAATGQETAKPRSETHDAAIRGRARSRGAPPPALAANTQIVIPPGAVELGSRPGTQGRDPSREADQVAVVLPGFRIDRLPYPNDPARDPMVDVSRERALALCEGAGKRLCTELEWERACKGPDGDRFATGSELELAHCRAHPADCLSDFGVAALGMRVQEWTASEAPSGRSHTSLEAVVRGGGTSDEVAHHRCAARSARPPDTASGGLGFRCCSSDGPDEAPARAGYPSEPERPLTRAIDAEVSELRSALSRIDVLSELAASFEPFTRRQIDAALRRGGRTRGSIALWTFQPAAFAWSPVPGEELWVLTGRTSQGTLLALLYPLVGGGFAHAASTRIAEPEGEIAIGVNEDYPNQLTWTTCFDCPGKGGIVVFAEDSTIRFAYR